MKAKINWIYLVSILLTIFVYWLPIEFGGSVLRWILAIILLGIYLYMIYIGFKATEKAQQISVVLWLTNSLAILHLTLIYISLMFSATATLIIGGLLGSALYYIVTRQIDQMIL